MKKFSREDHLSLAAWALNCAERVLDLFEEAAPLDDRPHLAIRTGRRWVGTGVFRMTEIREASLGAHAAAREIFADQAACLAARAAGQAVATAHVAQHAYGGAYYALKALIASSRHNAERLVVEEMSWQSQHLPERLRDEVMSGIILEERSTGLIVRVNKGPDF